MKARDHFLIVPSATLVAFLWGSNFVVINELIRFVGPLSILAVQFLACWPFLLIVKRPDKLHLVLLWSATAGVCQYAFQNKGLELGVSPGIASVLLQLQAFFTPLLLAIFFKERFSLQVILMLCVGILGVYCLSSIDSGQNASYTIAIVLLILASFSWAVGNVVITKMKHSGENNSMFSVLVYSGVMASIPITVWASIEEGSIIGKLVVLPMDNLFNIAGMFSWIILSYLGGYLVWNSLINRYGGGRVARYSLLVPVFGVALSYLVYGTQLSNAQILGIALILTALVVNQFLDARQV